MFLFGYTFMHLNRVEYVILWSSSRISLRLEGARAWLKRDRIESIFFNRVFESSHFGTKFGLSQFLDHFCFLPLFLPFCYGHCHQNNYSMFFYFYEASFVFFYWYLYLSLTLCILWNNFKCYLSVLIFSFLWHNSIISWKRWHLLIHIVRKKMS